jgi:hypothetical protein
LLYNYRKKKKSGTARKSLGVSEKQNYHSNSSSNKAANQTMCPSQREAVVAVVGKSLLLRGEEGEAMRHKRLDLKYPHGGTTLAVRRQ